MNKGRQLLNLNSDSLKYSHLYRGVLAELDVEVLYDGVFVCEKYPYINMDETCKYIIWMCFYFCLSQLRYHAPSEYSNLTCDVLDTLLVHESNIATLRSHTVWGIIRGLESFTQMVHNEPDFGYPVRASIKLCTSKHYQIINIDGCAN